MLPSQEFFDRMNSIGCDTDALREAYSQPPKRSIRINTLKLPLERRFLLGIELEPLPFSPLGFLVADDDLRLGRSPWHHAGAYYVQEPSAMSAVTVLDPQPGEYILDMCAAPGGKSTQIAAQMRNKGLLWCNEYVRSRATVLLSNIERMGISCAAVSSLHPDRIAETMAGMFDRVLVDAPCSGEGMFRKDDYAIHEWSPEHVAACAQRQAAILDSTAECVREGGIMVYSTCTFSPEENELNIAAFLERHPDFSLEPINDGFGRFGLNLSDKYDLTQTRRVYPMDGGEGHFVAKLRRAGERPQSHGEHNAAPPPAEVSALLDECFTSAPLGDVRTVGDYIYLLPPAYADFGSAPVIRAGLLLGTRKKNRIEPEHALFLAATAESCRNIIRLTPDSAELNAFLHGETIPVDDNIRGWCAVACGDIVTGFGKCSDGTLRNRYPKGLRLM